MVDEYCPVDPYWYKGSGTSSMYPTRNNGFCHTNGLVHCFHQEKIDCQIKSSIRSRNEKEIEVCCRCKFEQEKQTSTQIISRKSEFKCGRCHKEPATSRKNPYCKTCWKIVRVEAAEETKAAEMLMKSYNEKKMKRIQKEALEFAKT